MQYYFCAYGHVVRWSQKVATAEAAARECFGVAERVTVLPVGGRSPGRFSNAKKLELYTELKKLHKKRTGNDLTI